ncbi:MAG: LapA family protein [Proteobacteria bacterium]|nr:LapA family protein [Pseudomonadota bacterium]
MTGLKIIPSFFLLMVLTYFGIQFVEANRDEVMVTLGSWQSRPMALGFVVITSFFVGMVFSAALSISEVLRLHLNNHRMKRKLAELQSFSSASASAPQSATDLPSAKPSGRFN